MKKTGVEIPHRVDRDGIGERILSKISHRVDLLHEAGWYQEAQVLPGETYGGQEGPRDIIVEEALPGRFNVWDTDGRFLWPEQDSVAQAIEQADKAYGPLGEITVRYRDGRRETRTAQWSITEPHVVVWFYHPSQDKPVSEITAEVAATPKKRAIGLSQHEMLHPATGMLFLNPNGPEPRKETYHVGGVKFPFDLIFVRRDQRIGKIVHDIRPDDPGNWSYPRTSAVIEVVGGYCKSHGIGVGDLVRIGMGKEAQETKDPSRYILHLLKNYVGSTGEMPEAALFHEMEQRGFGRDDVEQAVDALVGEGQVVSTVQEWDQGFIPALRMAKQAQELLREDERREQMLKELMSDLTDAVARGEMTSEEANQWYNEKADQWASRGVWGKKAQAVCSVCGGMGDVFPCGACGISFCWDHGLEHVCKAGRRGRASKKHAQGMSMPKVPQMKPDEGAGDQSGAEWKESDLDEGPMSPCSQCKFEEGAYDTPYGKLCDACYGDFVLSEEERMGQAKSHDLLRTLTEASKSHARKG